jgi:hypothetical protein
MGNWRTLGLTLTLGLAVNTLAVAQPAFVEVTTVTVKPSGTADFEDYVKKINAGAAKIAASAPTFVYSARRGGRAFTYVVVTPFTKWADLDSLPSVPEILVKAYGEVEGNRIMKAGRANIEGVETGVERILHEVSSPPPPDARAAHVRVVHVEVKQGMGSTFEEYLGKLKAAQDKSANPPHVLRNVGVLGEVGAYTSVYFFDKYAQMDGLLSPPEAVRKYYKEGDARLIEELATRSIAGVHAEVFDFRPDLSRLPAAPPAK